MHKRKLQELNLLDDFFFNTMLNYPEIGEEFSRQLLKIIFRKNFGKLKVIAQKVYYGIDTDKHGARTIFLYTKGTKGNPPKKLMQFLRYMEHTIPENPTNDDLRYIQNMVETVKKSEEMSTAYMKIFEREEYLINKAIQKEKANTELERKRAENAEAKAADAESRATDAESRAKEMEAEILRLKEELLSLQTKK